MGLSDILSRIKSALGIGGSRRQQPRQGQYQQGQPRQGQPPQGQAQESADGHQQGTNVTVEREPSTGTEDAVKGTDTEPETTGGSESEQATRESGGEATDDAAEEVSEDSQEEASEDSSEEATEHAETTAAEESAESETDLGTDESTDVIKGIGSAYAERLSEAGVETVADLATGDAESLSEETGISETRLQNWIDRAKHR